MLRNSLGVGISRIGGWWNDSAMMTATMMNSVMKIMRRMAFHNRAMAACTRSSQAALSA